MNINSIPFSSRAFSAIYGYPVRMRFLAQFVPRFTRRRRKILADNVRDYRRATWLKRALDQLASADVVGMSVLEKPIGGNWRPFRVEHTLSGSLRGEFTSFRSGTFTGKVAPNVLESSSVLFLRDDEGKTLRVLIPSHGAAREMLAEALKSWARKAGHREGYYDGSTHVGRVVHNFALAGDWSQRLVHTQTIDMLDASCEKPVTERPVVGVMGRMLHEGVAFATGLRVNGETKTLLPTTFFAHLIRAMTEVGKLPPNIHLIATV